MFNNGEQKLITGEVITASIVANNNFQYTLQLNPTGEVAAVLPTGRINFSEAQLKQLAGKNGMSDFKSLLIALGKGGCSITIPFEFCKAGEVSPDNESITYTEDWWKANKVSAVFSFGDAANAFIEKLQMHVSGAAEVAASNEDRQKVTAGRIQLLLARNGKTPQTPKPAPKVKDDILGSGSEDESEDVLVKTKKK